MQRNSLVLLVVVLFASGTQAGLFDRKPKQPPAEQPAPANEVERVQTLVSALLLDKNAGKREDAAEQLGKLDGEKYPEAVTALIEAVQKDKDSDVRRTAVKSLGNIRPTSSEGLQALEQAGKDSSYLVRFEARLARWGYKVAEPPAPMPPAGGTVIKVPPAGPDGRLKPVPLPSVEPPPAEPKPTVKPSVSLSRPVPMTKGNAGDGPILVPPKQ